MSDWNERCRTHFRRTDAAVERFARASGLACPPDCGACCLTPEVETTRAELAPMAAALVDAGRAPEVLASLELADRTDDRRCVLYAADPTDPRRGRCTAYAERPLICRLFGFGARRDRTGAPELVACSTMRAADPAGVAAAAEAVRGGGIEAPVMADATHALAAERPDDGARQEPINRALRVALQVELLRRRLAAAELASEALDDPGPSDGPAQSDGPDDPNPETPPTAPPRAA